jgi:hypothetical protein
LAAAVTDLCFWTALSARNWRIVSSRKNRPAIVATHNKKNFAMAKDNKISLIPQIGFY